MMYKMLQINTHINESEHIFRHFHFNFLNNSEISSVHLTKTLKQAILYHLVHVLWKCSCHPNDNAIPLSIPLKVAET